MVNKFTPNKKNIWVAAGDGDLNQVKYLVQSQRIPPNTHDEFFYTPMHAAASYGHLDVLEYLISEGGDINVIDDENETPLYVVETLEVAQWLVNHGANPHWKNADRFTPADILREDFPEIANWLASLPPPPETPSTSTTGPDPSSVPPNPFDLPTSGANPQESGSSSGSQPNSHAQPSEYATEQSADLLTSQLLERVHDIMRRAEAEGRDPEQELQTLVGDTVLESLLRGVKLGDEADENAAASSSGGNRNTGERRAATGDAQDGAQKKSRLDDW